MKHLTFYFDFASPYAYLAFEEMPRTLMGLSYSMHYKPMCWRAITAHTMCDMSSATAWMQRHAQWLARTKGIALHLPRAHLHDGDYFLRLATATNTQGTPNRYVCETVLRHVWRTGGNPSDTQQVQDLHAQLPPLQQEIDSEAVRLQIQTHNAEAQAIGAVDVPAIAVDGRMFCGSDALAMLRDYLDGAT